MKMKKLFGLRKVKREFASTYFQPEISNIFELDNEKKQQYLIDALNDELLPLLKMLLMPKP